MDNLESFIESHKQDILKSNNPASENTIKEGEKLLDMNFGVQLREYFSNYGFLAYKFVELYGFNDKEKMMSDAIKSTISLRKRFKILFDVIVIEDMGDGDYIVCDSNDNIFEYIPSIENSMRPLNVKLKEYITKRFISVE